MRALAAARLHWLKCPLAEVASNSRALRRIRAAANDQGVLIAVAPVCEALEMPFDESPLYAALVGGLPPALRSDGTLPVPMGVGLGVSIEEALLGVHLYRPVPLGIEAASASG